MMPTPTEARLSAAQVSKARLQLLDILDDSVQCAISLQAALEQERGALQTQDLVAIDQAVVDKTVLIERLQRLEQKRSAACGSWGYPSGGHEMHEILDACDDGGILQDRWQQLMVIAELSRDLNATNGAIIRVRQQHFESSLALLRGTAPGADTYGRSGAEPGDFNRRAIAQA